MDEKYASYLEGWRERHHRAEMAAARRRRRGRLLARRCAAVLAAEYGARRVWLFGSLTTGRVGSRSDIDLLVEGVRPEDFLRALARCDQVTGGFPLDLVDAAECREDFLRLVRDKGVLLLDEGKLLGSGRGTCQHRLGSGRDTSGIGGGGEPD
ncbi:MAG: nucleotidyltransferase domain-containing protein [Thermaerobacter sp.]|nr:nucleotidyltransferase domain-containing protein [Thermaerobacter sp.]